MDTLPNPAPPTLPQRPRLPPWLRLQLPQTPVYDQTRHNLAAHRLHTVCQSAKCPNQWECWSKGTATFMIAGDRCTRACGFCAVTTAKPFPLDPNEPERVAESAAEMHLRHAVVTAVARDDLADGGADHFRQTILALRRRLPGIVVEVLTPDFQAKPEALDCVISARPDIFNHNIETVRRLTPTVRHRATYDRSLEVLRYVRQACGNTLHTKSGMMLGLGETEAEIIAALEDLRAVECDILTLGQYLPPSAKHLPVVEYITPEQFVRLARKAQELGFAHVFSGPLVRSSYHAHEVSVGK